MKDAKGHGSNARGGSYQNVSDKPLVTNAARERIESQSGMSYDKWVAAGRPNLGSGEGKVHSTAAAHGVPTAHLVPGSPGTYRPDGTYNPRYNRQAVDNAIASSNRAGRRIGGKEAKMIHALLRGRD